MPKPSFKIGKRILKQDAVPYVIAEIGSNHNCDIKLARKLINAAKDAGADAVKFQSFHTEEFLGNKKLAYSYKRKGRKVKENMFDMFKRLELPDEWHRELQIYAHSIGLEFLSSVADVRSVDLLISLKVPVLKLASEDLINIPLLEYIAYKRKPVILSTGMADQAEIDCALKLLSTNGCPNILLLHCVSLYPTPDRKANLLRIKTLRERYGTLVGYSDHTSGNEAAIAAVALGAVLIEKHFTLDSTLYGPDHSFSSEPGELKELVSAVRKVAKLKGSNDIEPDPAEIKVRRKFRRSVVAAVEIPKNTIITREMLSLKRPGNSIHPFLLIDIIGKRAKKTYKINEQLKWEGLK